MKLTKLQRNIFECLEQGLKTKEIMEKLGCSEDSVKRTRANKELKALYDSQKHEEKEVEVKTAEEAEREEIKAVIVKMINSLGKIAGNENTPPSELIAASKQLLELKNMFKEYFPAPKASRTIKIEYAEPKAWQIFAKAELAIEKEKEQLREKFKAEMCAECPKNE